MRSFPKLSAGIVVGVIAAAVLAGGAFAQKKDGEKPPAKDKKEEPKAPAKPDKGKGAKDAKDEKAGEPSKLDIPVSKDHDAKGLKVPYFDGDGKKQMIFTIGVASRLDEEHIGLTETLVETFDENGEHEMTIDLPKSELNVTTSVLTTKKHVEIKREDFSITGETLEFNMKTKRGGLGGGVKMLIYNIQEELPDAPAPKTP